MEYDPFEIKPDHVWLRHSRASLRRLAIRLAKEAAAQVDDDEGAAYRQGFADGLAAALMSLRRGKNLDAPPPGAATTASEGDQTCPSP